jgi:hypothetical protein
MLMMGTPEDVAKTNAMVEKPSPWGYVILIVVICALAIVGVVLLSSRAPAEAVAAEPVVEEAAPDTNVVAEVPEPILELVPQEEPEPDRLIGQPLVLLKKVQIAKENKIYDVYRFGIYEDGIEVVMFNSYFAATNQAGVSQ